MAESRGVSYPWMSRGKLHPSGSGSEILESRLGVDVRLPCCFGASRIIEPDTRPTTTRKSFEPPMALFA